MESTNSILHNLFTRLDKLSDHRRKEGQRHTQNHIIAITMFATMSGYIGYRAIGDFITKHDAALIELLKPKKEWLPSFSTVRRTLLNINSAEFKKIYKDWLSDLQMVSNTAKSPTEQTATSNSATMEESDWYGIDGKVIRGASNMSQEAQTHLVSIFASFEKIVVDSQKVAAKTNEIPCVQKMIQESDLEQVIFTLDALHCQKKTVAEIIDSNNDYVIAVKKNQPQLYGQIQATIEEENPIDMDYTLEKSRGRQEEREVIIYEAQAIDKQEWKGVCQILQVNRRVLHSDGRQSYQEAFYIDSTGKSAADLNRGIRAHWAVENSLH